MTTMTETQPVQTYERHHLSSFVRSFTSEEKARLYDSLKRDGYDPGQPIVLYEHEVLDGWNRYEACCEMGVAPTYTTFEGTDEEARRYVIRANMIRRHLTIGQLATAEIRLDASKPTYERRSDAQLAGDLHASPGTVAQARKVAEMEPALADKVVSGEMKFSEAQREMRSNSTIKRTGRKVSSKKGIVAITFDKTRSSDIQLIAGVKECTTRQVVLDAVDVWISEHRPQAPSSAK